MSALIVHFNGIITGPCKQTETHQDGRCKLTVCGGVKERWYEITVFLDEVNSVREMATSSVVPTLCSLC